MRNLKKILSLALALVMVFSLMTFASAQDFSDAADIEHTEAVEVLTALEVIDGVGNNTFNPNGKVTRAQMAKMITLISLGNVSVDAFKGVDVDLTDINGHWAEAYIKYCYSQGIISGKGGGRFDPDANVTTVEAAKMLLVAIGYNSDVQIYEGPQWNVNVIRDAQTNDIFEKLALASDLQINRDQAAQMMYNALTTGIIEKSSSVDRNDGSIIDQYIKNDGKSLLGESFKGQTWVGTFTGNWNTEATNVKGEIQVFGNLEGATTVVNGVVTPVAPKNANFPFDYDIANIGEEVKVIFKDGTSGVSGVPDRYDTIYGVYKTGGTSVVNTTTDSIKNLKDNKAQIKVGSTTYNTENTVAVNVNMTGSVDFVATNGVKDSSNSALTNKLKQDRGDTIKLILNDEGKVESAYITETRISYVTAVNSEKVSLVGVGAIEIAKNDVYDGIARNDVVNVTTLYKDWTDSDDEHAYTIVTAAESVTGEVTGFKTTKDKNNNDVYENVSIDGTAHKIYNQAAMRTTVGEKDGKANFSTNEIGDTYILYLVNGYVGYAVLAEEDANQYAVVTAIDDQGEMDSTFKTPRVELLLADGSKVSVTVHKDSELSHNDSNVAAFGVYTAANKLNKGDKINTALKEGQIVKYSVVSDNVYKLYMVGAYDTTSVYNKDTKTFDGTVTDGNCPLFVCQATSDGPEWKVYNIRDLGNITASAAVTGFNSNTAHAGKYVDGGKVMAAVITLSGKPSGSSSNMFYGIVSAVNGNVRVDGDDYKSWTVSNETESKTVLVPSNGRCSLKKGDLVGFDVTNDNTYKASEIKTYTGTSDKWQTNGHTVGLATWGKSYPGDKTITVWGNVVPNGSGYKGATGTEVTYALDDDCVIVYVDQDGDKGGYDASVGPFDEVNNYRNLLLVKENGTDAANVKVVAIFVETSTKTDITGTKPAVQISSNSDFQELLQNTENNDPITFSGTPAADTVIPEGKTVTFTGNSVTVKDVKGNASFTGSGTTTITGAVSGNVTTENDANLIGANITGTVSVGGALTGSGTVTVGKTGSLNVSGNIDASTTKITGGGKVDVGEEGSVNGTLDQVITNLGATLTVPTTIPADKKVSLTIPATTPVLSGKGDVTGYWPGQSIEDEMANSGSTTGQFVKITIPQASANGKYLLMTRIVDGQEVKSNGVHQGKNQLGNADLDMILFWGDNVDGYNFYLLSSAYSGTYEGGTPTGVTEADTYAKVTATR